MKDNGAAEYNLGSDWRHANHYVTQVYMNIQVRTVHFSYLLNLKIWKDKNKKNKNWEINNNILIQKYEMKVETLTKKIKRYLDERQT